MQSTSQDARHALHFDQGCAHGHSSSVMCEHCSGHAAHRTTLHEMHLPVDMFEQVPSEEHPILADITS